jgi:hypothetical protein
MHKNATKCKQNTKQMVHKQAWSIKIIDTFETYQRPTPIGTAGRAPDEDGNIGFTIGVNYRLHHQ